MADLLNCIFHGADHIVSLSTGYVTPGSTCTFFGYGIPFDFFVAWAVPRLLNAAGKPDHLTIKLDTKGLVRLVKGLRKRGLM